MLQVIFLLVHYIYVFVISIYQRYVRLFDNSNGRNAAFYSYFFSKLDNTNSCCNAIPNGRFIPFVFEVESTRDKFSNRIHDSLASRRTSCYEVRMAVFFKDAKNIPLQMGLGSSSEKLKVHYYGLLGKSLQGHFNGGQKSLKHITQLNMTFEHFELRLW